MNSAVKKSIAFISNANYVEAVYLLKKTLRNNPKDLQALNILGQVQIKLGDYEDAAKNLAKSIAINPYDCEILSRLGYAYEKTERYEEAIEQYRKSLAIKPDQVHVYDCLGRTLAKSKHNYEAILYFLKALEFTPHDKDIHKNIGYISKDTGLYELTLKHYEIARQLDPTDEQCLSCLIFNSHKDPSCDFARLQHLAQAYSEQALPKPKSSYAEQVLPRLDLNRTKLRLGFVSADLRAHPVSYYLLKVLQKMNSEEFEFCFYSNHPFEDQVTREFQDLALDFKIIADVEDEFVARTIYEDQIDILFDMSGFTKGHRLSLFKYKAAPVQVTHIGYFGTLGMPEMDFLIADEHLIKPEEEKYFTEKVYKMDSCYVHCASYDLPEPAAQAPCADNAYVSFGSMNSPHKISREVIKTWSEILHENSNTKLIVDNQFLSTDSNKEFIRQSFAKHGVGLDRLELRSSVSRQEFLASYADIDIALDAFPYGGGTSTIEALMLGVPVIALNGDRWVARQSKDFLFNAGHMELVANTVEDYKRIASELAADPRRIEAYRKNLKSDVENSAMNLDAYVPNFEKAVWDMWLIKCKGE